MGSDWQRSPDEPGTGVAGFIRGFDRLAVDGGGDAEHDLGAAVEMDVFA